MNTVYIGLGSNIGNRKKNISRAIKLISELPACKIAKKSSLYLTSPVGPRQSNFINSVIEVKSSHEPKRFLNELKNIEKKLGRKRNSKWGPRKIDLDILFYGSNVSNEKGLKIPHPEIHKRLFVLEPLNQIAASFVHPGKSKTVNYLRKKALLTYPMQKVKILKTVVRDKG